MKAVAILLSTYNGERFLREQIDSILRQTYTHIKLYIHDDGSTDATKSIIYEYGKLFPNQVVIIDEKKHFGYPDCFWYLLRKCPASDYYAFCDQDDVWDKTKIDVAVKRMNSQNNKNPVLYIHDYENCSADLSIISTHRLKKFLPLTERNILFFTVASGFSMIINNKLRDMLNAEQLMKHGVFHDEWCIWTAFFNGTVLYEDCIMAKYRRHSSAYTTYGNSTKTLLYSWIFDEVLGDDFSKKCDRIRYFLCKDGCITESAKKEWKFLARRRGEPGYLKRLFFPHRLRPSLSGEIALRILFLLNT